MHHRIYRNSTLRDSPLAIYKRIICINVFRVIHALPRSKYTYYGAYINNNCRNALTADNATSRLWTHSRGWIETLRVAFLRSAFGMHAHLGHGDRIVCEANLYPPPPRNEGNNHFQSRTACTTTEWLLRVTPFGDKPRQ